MAAQGVAHEPGDFATGSLTFEGATAEVKFAVAFIDQSDERKPIVLVISDQKLPVKKWEHEGGLQEREFKRAPLASRTSVERF